MTNFLSTIAIFKNEADILDEWIRHHLWQGVEHFYLINNNSSDHYLDILQPYLNSKIITLYNLFGKYRQVEYYNIVFQKIYQDTVWLMVIDLDEFYYCTSKPLQYYIKYNIDKKINHIINVWKIFGSSGYIQQPKNIRDSFIHRVPNPYDLYHKNSNCHKYIIKTEDTIGLGCHNPKLSKKSYKLMNHPNIKLNHYQIMSEQYFQKVKMTRGAADTPAHEHIRNMEYFNKRNINTILDCELKNLVINNYNL